MSITPTTVPVNLNKKEKKDPKRSPRLDFFRNHKLILSCYVASFIAFLITLYMIFYSQKLELQQQAFSWFIITVVCLLLPSIGPLIERISHLKVGELELDLNKVKETMDKVEIIFRVNEYLALDEHSHQEEGKIETDIKKAPRSTLTLIYAAASDFREQTVYSILRTHQDNEEERNAFRSRLQCLVPIFRGLIEAQQAREDMRHHYYAQLAYVYKDQPIQSNNPKKNWDNALENLDAAIEQRKKLYLDNLKFGIYEFNRLVCKININVITASTKYSHEELMKDFNTVYNDAGIRYMLFGTSEYIAPNLLKWIEGNPETKVNYKEWLDERENRNSSTTS